MENPAVLNHPCERCGAKPGALCTTPAGNLAKMSHAVRINLVNPKFVTKTGKVLTDADIEALAEAERGYDIKALKSFKRKGSPAKGKFKVRCRTYVWCDYHSEIHQAEQDLYGIGETDICGQIACAPHNWRRIYVASDYKNETF